MPRWLSIDYGLQRVGLAVSDPSCVIATPLCCVPAHELMDYLKEYQARETILGFVVGYPSSLDQRPTHSTKAVERLCKNLEKTFAATPVYKVDERYTSRIAKQSLHMAGLSQKRLRRKNGDLDKIAATLILQTFLASNAQVL